MSSLLCRFKVQSSFSVVGRTSRDNSDPVFSLGLNYNKDGVIRLTKCQISLFAIVITIIFISQIGVLKDSGGPGKSDPCFEIFRSFLTSSHSNTV